MAPHQLVGINLWQPKRPPSTTRLIKGRKILTKPVVNSDYKSASTQTKVDPSDQNMIPPCFGADFGRRQGDKAFSKLWREGPGLLDRHHSCNVWRRVFAAWTLSSVTWMRYYRSHSPGPATVFPWYTGSQGKTSKLPSCVVRLCRSCLFPHRFFPLRTIFYPHEIHDTDTCKNDINTE